MKILRTLFLLQLLVLANTSWGQGSSIRVYQDSRMELLSQKQAELNRRAKIINSSGYRPGYRLQVYNATNRDEANPLKAELLRRFPEHRAYLLYQAPNFRIRLGNFLSQADANNLRKQLVAMYPGRSIYIVRDRVEYRPFEDDID